MTLLVTEGGARRGVTADLGFNLSGRSLDDDGPTVGVELTIELRGGETLEEIEEQALLAALSVLKRLTLEPEESWAALLARSRVAD
jgi:hypothetical protein